MKKLNYISLIVMIFAFAFISQAYGQKLITPLTIDELTEESDIVVVGKVINIKCDWDEKHSFIFTYITMKCSDYLKGKDGDTIIIRQMGGTAGNRRLRVDGDESFAMSEYVVVFLNKQNVTDKYYRVTRITKRFSPSKVQKNTL